MVDKITLHSDEQYFCSLQINQFSFLTFSDWSSSGASPEFDILILSWKAEK